MRLCWKHASTLISSAFPAIITYTFLYNIHLHIVSFSSYFLLGMPEDMLVAVYKVIQLKMHYIFTPEAYTIMPIKQCKVFLVHRSSNLTVLDESSKKRRFMFQCCNNFCATICVKCIFHWVVFHFLWISGCECIGSSYCGNKSYLQSLHTAF